MTHPHDPRFLDEQFALAGEYRLGVEPTAAPGQPALPGDAARSLARARLLVRRGDLVGATAAAAETAALAPRSPDARGLLAALLLETGDVAAAGPHAAATAGLAPSWAVAWQLCGEAAWQAGDADAARHHFRRALGLRPDWPEVSRRLGECLVKLGDFADGFALMEVRPLVTRPDATRWDGRSPLWGKSVLITAEREIGDLIQFARYAESLKRRGATVLLTCPGDLVPLLSGVPGLARAVPLDLPPPRTDLFVPLLSLPHVLGTTLASVPAVVPYLTADAGRVAAWRRRLATAARVNAASAAATADAAGAAAGAATGAAPQAAFDGGLRVGLVWADAGEPGPTPVRSAPLADLSPLWAVAGVTWFALQQGPPAAERPFCDTPLVDLSAELTGADEIVAVVAALDLLVAVDTPALHVAGALGRPAWALLAAACDWRWLGGGETTPWYPSVRCFRQAVAGDWAPVAARAAGALVEATEALKRER